LKLHSEQACDHEALQKFPILLKKELESGVPFLSSGISNNFFLSATVIITGIAKKVIVKEMATDSKTSNTFNISQVLYVCNKLRATNLAGWVPS
jgi:hypothetical protein